MTVFAQYRRCPEDVMDRNTGELLNKRTARLIVSPSLLAVDGMFIGGKLDPLEDKFSTEYRESGAPQYDEDEDEGSSLSSHAKRGEITEFSRQSQARLMKRLACWEPQGPLWVCTLTYPSSWPSGERCREDFNKFRRLMRRQLPELAGMWKLEYQKRGAPHYHLVLESGRLEVPEFLERLRSWFDRAWMVARGSIVPARTQVHPARDPDRARFYLAKEVGKMVQSSAYWREQCERDVKHVGRFWGWIAKEQIKFAAAVVEVSAAAAWAFRRRVQEVVARSLVERKLLSHDDEGRLLKRDGTLMDGDALPTWQLTTNARALARRICEELRADGVQLPAFDDWAISPAPY